MFTVCRYKSELGQILRMFGSGVKKKVLMFTDLMIQIFTEAAKLRKIAVMFFFFLIVMCLPDI